MSRTTDPPAAALHDRTAQRTARRLWGRPVANVGVGGRCRAPRIWPGCVLHTAMPPPATRMPAHHTCKPRPPARQPDRAAVAMDGGSAAADDAKAPSPDTGRALYTRTSPASCRGPAPGRTAGHCRARPPLRRGGARTACGAAIRAERRPAHRRRPPCGAGTGRRGSTCRGSGRVRGSPGGGQGPRPGARLGGGGDRVHAGRGGRLKPITGRPARHVPHGKRGQPASSKCGFSGSKPAGSADTGRSEGSDTAPPA